MKKYPIKFNDWNWGLDFDSMLYWKQVNNRYEAICLFKIDPMDGDLWIGFSADGDTFADAVEMLGIMPFEIVDAMPREEAEKELIKYMGIH